MRTHQPMSCHGDAKWICTKILSDNPNRLLYIFKPDLRARKKTWLNGFLRNPLLSAEDKWTNEREKKNTFCHVGSYFTLSILIDLRKICDEKTRKMSDVDIVECKATFTSPRCVMSWRLASECLAAISSFIELNWIFFSSLQLSEAAIDFYRVTANSSGKRA